MLRKWKEKERWTERRRSEPYGGREEEEEDEDEEQRKTDRRDRQIHKRMLRRKSEPCGQTEEDQKTEEKKSEGGRKKEYRKFESNMEEEDRKDRRKTETGRGKDRRKSASWIIVDDKAGGQTDRRQKEVDRRTLRRRSEPCSLLYVQLLPLSNRKRRELLQKRTGRRMSCSEEVDGQTNRRHGDGQMTRGRSEPIGPLDYSKQKTASTLYFDVIIAVLVVHLFIFTLAHTHTHLFHSSNTKPQLPCNNL